MSFTYTKLFSSITESTVWCESYSTRIVWVAMLAMADKHGRVWGSIPGLARRANVTLEEAEAALQSFQAPDTYSRTPDHDGRRIEPLPGGWRLLNHGKYRAIRDEEDQRARNAERQARFRAKQADEPVTNVTESCDSNAPSQDVTPDNPIADASADADPSLKAIAQRFAPSDIEIIYQSYPRHIGKRKALTAIEAALKRIDDANSVERLLAIVQEYAASPAGQRGQFTPYPATWFNASSYLDDPAEWEQTGGQR
jgi:hypothetical protein